MYRKGVSALITNKDQKFLLVNLESFEKRFFAIPGGGLDDGETLEDAVYREIQEELNIEKESLEFVGKSDISLLTTFKTKKITESGIVYTGSERYFFGFRFVGDEKEIKPRDGEVRSFQWVPLSELKDYLLFDNQLEDTLEKIREIFPDLI